MIVINEARTIQDEYEKTWSDIPQDIFNKIILLDPATNIDRNFIGPSAKQLLLPQYIEGETEFVEDPEVKKALETFIANRASYPQTLRNLSNFPSVKDFVEYITKGDESDFAKNFDLNAISTTREEKSPLDTIYDKYYSKLAKEDFKKIIVLDPETTEKSVGPAAKNLLLRCALAGEDLSKIDPNLFRKALNYFNAEKSSVEENKQKLEKYESVKDFIDYWVKGPEAEWITRLKSLSVSEDIIFYEGTREFDILEPLSHQANNAISCLAELRSRGNEYHKWCTGWTGDRSQWNSHSAREYIYCFINKKAPKDRKVNYQLAIRKDNYTVYQFLDGNDEAFGDFNAGSETSTKFFKSFLLSNPDMIDACLKIPQLQNCPTLLKCADLVKYTNGEYEVNSIFDVVRLKRNDELKLLIKKVKINIEHVPSLLFADCPALTAVDFSDTVKTIGDESFMRCIGLKTLALPSSIESIGSEAFAYCNSLHGTVRIPDSLVRIGHRAFYKTQCKLSINKDRPNKLKIDPEDMDWFMSHAKVISLQENLDSDIDLFENLPPDLAQAYRKAQFGSTRSVLHPGFIHNEISPRYRRSGVKFDYKNANYEEINTNRALELITLTGGIKYGENGEPLLDEYGKYIVKKPRVHDKETCKQNLPKLRILAGGVLSEFEVFEPYGAVKAIYGGVIPQDLFGQYPDTFYHNTSYINSYTELYILLQICEKIYLTDEYEHRIGSPDDRTTSNILPGRKIKVARLDPDTHQPVLDDAGNPIYDIVDDTIEMRRGRKGTGIQTHYSIKDKNDPSYIPHAPYHNLVPSSRVDLDLSDTGRHIPDSLSSDTRLRNLDTAQRYKQEAYVEYDLARKALNRLTKNSSHYADELEYEQEVQRLTELKDSAYRYYLDTALDYRKAKDKFVGSFNSEVAAANKRLVSWAETLENYSTKLFNLKNKISDAELNSVAKAEPVLRIENDVKTLETKINNLQESTEDAKRKIEELQRLIQNNEQEIERVGDEVLAKNSAMEAAVQEAMKAKFELIASWKQNYDEIQRQLDAARPARRNTANAEVDNQSTSAEPNRDTDSAASALRNLLSIE